MGVPAVLVLCTGNAARSVMAGFMLEQLATSAGRPLRVVTAGTHTLEGQPMGRRTREALVAIEPLAGVPVSRHRSHQLVAGDLEKVDLVVAMEADHVAYVRRTHPDAAARTGTLTRLVRALPEGPAPLADRVRALDLAGAPLDRSEDVADPAGQDADVYAACAVQLWKLTQELFPRLYGE